MRTRPAPSAHIEHFALDPTLVFLNHGSFGACPRAVLYEQSRLRAELEANPVRFLARELPIRIDHARERLARLVHAPVDELVFVANATSGVSSVLRSLRWNPGDVVVTTSHDYVGCRSALLEVAERERLEVRVVDVPFVGIEAHTVEERVLAAVDARVRLVMLDHVSSTTGLVFPIASLVGELERRGIPVLVDGAHAPGMVPLDLAALGASYYAGNAHKWLCAPKGTAIFHARRDRQSDLLPGTVSIGTRFPRAGRNPFHERFDWPGTTDPTAWLALPAAIAFLEGALPGGLDEVRASNRALVLEARARFLARFGGSAPAPDSMIASMVSMPLEGRLAELAARGAGAGPSPLVARLADEFGIEVLVARFGDGWVLRMTAQLYNAPEQYVYLLDVLDELAR